jgi:hypothetical protein
MGKKLTVEEALEILANTDSYYLKRDMQRFLKKRGVKTLESH